VPFDLKSLCLLHALLDDRCISFNINRPRDSISPFPRHIVAILSASAGEIVVPGVACTSEKLLLGTLKKVGNWRRVKEHSFDLNRKLFSLLWRFSGRGTVARDQLSEPSILDPREARTVRAALKKYRSFLEGNLRQGKIFLIPDRELTFNSPNRFRQDYARPVLVFRIRDKQVVIIPFSTRLERINKGTDILFDSAHQGERLAPEGRPAVENYPYNFFSRKTALIVNASQSVTKEHFFASALLHVGTVRIDLLEFVKKRMKNRAL